MPTIRIDQEIYDYLNEKGKTADTFSDVLRRELGLDQKPTKGQIMRHMIPGLADDQRSHRSRRISASSWATAMVWTPVMFPASPLSWWSP